MTSQVFTSETPVADRADADRRVSELAHLAEQWFGGPVSLVSNEIASRQWDGVLEYVLTARFIEPRTQARANRVERAARWLGLTR